MSTSRVGDDRRRSDGRVTRRPAAAAAADGDVADMTMGVYRRVYSGQVDDRRMAEVSIEAEAWRTRALVAADDFGNVPADPDVFYTRTVGRRLGSVTVGQVTAWADELVGAGLLLRYEVAGEWYFHIADFARQQPGPRNGKRIRRAPASPFDGVGNGPTGDDGADAAGVPGGVRGSPDASSASKSPDTDTDTDTEAQEDAPAAQATAEAAGRASAATPARPSPALVFPVVAKRGAATEWPLTVAHVAELRETFPAVDVPAACREALSWCRANVDRRKTAKGMPAFLHRWMSGEQDRPRQRSGGWGAQQVDTPEARSARIRASLVSVKEIA